MQVQPTMLGEGHIRIYGTLQIGHTIHEGHQRLQCWPFPDKTYEDFVFTLPPGVEPGQRVVWSVEAEFSLYPSILMDRSSLLSSSAPTSRSAMRSS